MCANFEPVIKRERLKQYFGVDTSEPCPSETWPGHGCHFVRRTADRHGFHMEAHTGLYGLVPHWAKDLNIGRHTYNARTETVAELPSFRDAWQRQQHCIVPIEAFYEPCWETGKSVRWRIANNDGTPMGIAGLWSAWHGPDMRWVLSVTMLTINADGHPVMQRFHKPDDEKRMVVVLRPEDYHDWLMASPADARSFFHRYPAEKLHVEAAPLIRATNTPATPQQASRPADSQGSLF